MLRLLASAPMWAVRSVQQRGLGQTAAIVTSFAADYTFDWKYGTETHIQTHPDYGSDAKAAGFFHYQATKAGPFVAMIEALNPPANSVFVDVGCGKGKALLLAGQMKKNGRPRFKRVIGLEYDQGLCEQARRNVEIFERKEALPPVEVIQGDAAQHAFAGDENVIFLYNSFDDKVLRRFLKTVERSHATHPRDIVFVYGAPQFSELVDDSGIFEERRQLICSGNKFYVYTVGPQGATKPLRYASA